VKNGSKPCSRLMRLAGDAKVKLSATVFTSIPCSIHAAAWSVLVYFSFVLSTLCCSLFLVIQYGDSAAVWRLCR